MDDRLFMKKAEAVFLAYIESRGHSQATVTRKKAEFRRFMMYLAKNERTDVREMTDADLEKYLLHLRERGFLASTQVQAKSVLKDLFHALATNDLLMKNPYDLLEVHIREQAGVKVILTVEEMDRFLSAIDIATGLGYRDRTMFELFYVTGMRCGELMRLKTVDVDFSLNEVLIRQGKGRKDRIVPFGRVCCQFLTTWTGKMRQWFVKGEDPGFLFLNKRGGGLAASVIGYRLRMWLAKAGIIKPGVSPHSLRHSCATHLLMNGANIRYVQELLGHASIETTVEYTRGIVEGLKKVHRTYHPRENELYPSED